MFGTEKRHMVPSAFSENLMQGSFVCKNRNPLNLSWNKWGGIFIVKIREGISRIQVKKCSKTSQGVEQGIWKPPSTKTAIPPPVSYPGLLDLFSLDISPLFFPLKTSSLWLSPFVYMANELSTIIPKSVSETQFQIPRMESLTQL